MAKQQRNEQLRLQFAMQANRLGPWLERALDALFATQNAPGNLQLEQQMAGYKKMEEELNKMKPVLLEAESCYQVLKVLLFLFETVVLSFIKQSMNDITWELD